jgi:hypothetical protein
MCGLCSGYPINSRASRPTGIPLEALPEHLAAAGVLYRAAVTDDQAVKLGADAVGELPTDPTEIALCVRGGGERIARGAQWCRRVSIAH